MRSFLAVYSIVGCISYAYSYISISKINTNHLTVQFLHSHQSKLFANKNDFDDMGLDESKLSDKEKDRIQFIKKLSLEADEMIKNAGFAQSDEEDERSIEIKDTNWSGQSDVEVSRVSKNNFGDILDRWGLAIGDISAFVVFAAIGRSNHNEDGGLIDTLLTAAPFALSWILISPFLGAYSRQATSALSSLPLGILPSLAVSTISGLAIRAVIKGYTPPIIFAILTFIFPFILLCIWRAVYIKLVGTTSDEANKNAGVFEVFKMIGTLIKRW